MATATPDLLNPNTPKKLPSQPQAQTSSMSAPQPSALDTGVPPPASPAPAPPQQAAAAAPPPSQQAAATPAPAPAAAAPPPQTYDASTAVQQLNQQMMTRHNRVLTPQEVETLGRAVGPPQGPAGTYTAAQLAQAQDLVSRYSGDLNNPFPAQAPAPPNAPAAPIPAPPPPLVPGAPTPHTALTGEQAVQYLNLDAQGRIGRTLTPAEIQQLATAVGAPQGPGGTYTPAQVNIARDWVNRYSGDPANPFGPLQESAPGSTTNLANQRIDELLGMEWGEVDPNAQAIQQPLGAFRAAQSRATDRARIAMALRNQNQGISGGAEEAGLLGLLEEQGLNEANFESGLITQELKTQRDALQNAIQLATQAGLQNKARELQAELGKLDIALRQRLGEGQLRLGAQSLEQNDRHFLEQLGFNFANLQAQLNSRAIDQLLGA